MSIAANSQSAKILQGTEITLAPSSRGVGPNTYLGISYFWAMLLAAVIVHMAVLVISGLLPKQPVKDIPVRALSFKLGDADRIAAYGSLQGVGETLLAANAAATTPSEPMEPKAPAPVLEAQEPPVLPLQQPAANIPATAAASPTPAAASSYQPQTTVASTPSYARQKPIENDIQNDAPPMAAPTQPVALPSAPATPAQSQIAMPPVMSPPPAIAPTPQRFIREAGLPSLDALTGATSVPRGGQQGAGNMGYGIAEGAIGGKGVENTMTPQTADAIRKSYEQEISVWIERHKIYPSEAGGTTGRVIMRMRVDRQGYVRYYAIERSSGNAALDRAGIEMIRRANPVPSAPANYPSDNLIEFLIPILFEAP